MAKSFYRRKKIYLIAGLGILFMAGLAFAVILKSRAESITIQHKKYQVEISDTQQERERGLSGHQPLKNNEGMLFIYDQPDRNCFWMKDMKFNIDILWFDVGRKLVYKQINLAPQSYPTTFCPPVAAQYVVELKANEAAALQVGDQLSF